jgi:hypothetical protein
VADLREDIVQESADEYPIGDAKLDYDPKPAVSTEPDEDRKALVQDLLKKINQALKDREPRFKKMKEELKFARAGSDRKAWAEGNYVANFTARHIRQKTAQLYAKNPRARARRAEKCWFQVWDGNAETAQAAMQLLATAATMPFDAGYAVPPELMQQVMQAQNLMADIAQGLEKMRSLDKVGKTLEILFHHFLKRSNPPFKTSAKQLVRRVVGTGVGYVKLGFQRLKGRDPTIVQKLNDMQEQVTRLEYLIKQVELGDEAKDLSAKREELTVSMANLMMKQEIILQEGVVFDFPKSWNVIPVGRCISLKGFIGAEGVAERMMFTPEEIEELYGVKLKDGKYKSYTEAGVEGIDYTHGKTYVCLFEYYHPKSGTVYTLIDGYDDFVEEPRKPTVNISQFYPYFTLSWNDLEIEGEDCYPPSDVELMMHQQSEHNRQRESLRQHRIANTPKYAADSSALEQKDERMFMTVLPHEIMKLNALAAGKSIKDVIQPIAQIPLDPQLYNTAEVYTDYLLVTGSQQAELGPTAGDTATEVTVAARARGESTSADVDELDDMLTALADATGQVMLLELSPETVRKIAGDYAVWPDWSAQEAKEMLYLEIEAGSSGKPRQAVELLNWEKLVPLALQIPGISPSWIAKETVKRMDDRVDISEALIEGAPAIMVANRQQQVLQKGLGGPPEAQGDKGSQNTPRQRGQGGPQPGQGQFPAPGQAVQ